MSPELAQKKEYLGGASDIWALGVVLYILLTGRHPFFGEFEHDLFRKIRKCKYRWPDLLYDEKNKDYIVPEGGKNLVARIFTHNERKRPTAEDILADPWLQLGTSRTIIKKEKAPANNNLQPITQN